MEAGELDISSPSEMTKVSVAVRVRPLIEREKKADAQIHWQVGPKELRPFDAEARRIVPNSPTYTYDHVFTQSTQTQQVYDKVVSPIVKKAFKGFNGTILCYGQTSSGKTHTLYGSNDDKGIILLFADHLFQHIKADETRRQYIIKVGLIEIYNEKVTDLLNSYNPIELQERDGSVVPHGLEELTVFDIDDWKKVTERVQRERKIGETRMNKESSRSHTILRVTIESFDLTSSASFDEDQEISEQSPPLTTAVLHFVDLAGSEKQSQTGAEGERFREQVNINMSLSVLSRVIQQLSEQASVSEAFQGRPSSNDHSLAKAMVNSMVRNAPRSRFINFRDSKLTRLLQSSLNGDAYISMVCNVTIASYEETKSTLLFAKQAKKIQIRPKQNLCSTKSEYEKKLQELQDLLSSKDKEVLVLRRQCENMKRAFVFRDEQSTQRPTNVDRRLSLCPTMFRPTSSKPRHSNPEPMTTFIYYKNKYASSGKLNASPGDEFMSADEFVKSLRSPLKSGRESTGSGVCLDKGVQTDLDSAGSEAVSSRLHSLTTIPESVSEVTQQDQEVQTDEKEEDSKPCATPKEAVPRRVIRDGTPVSTLRLNNALLRTVNEEDKLEWEEQKAFLELENAALQEEVTIIPTLKTEIESLKLEKQELENDVMRQMQASRVEINRRLAESPEVLELKKKLEETLEEKENLIKEKDSELLDLKEKLKSYYEMQPKLTELEGTMSTLISTNEALEQERSIRDGRAKETELQHQQTTDKLMAVIETNKTELRKRDDQIEKLQSTLQENRQERVDLDSDLLNAQKVISSLKSDEVKLKEELNAQQVAFEEVKLSVQTMKEELALNQLAVQERDTSIEKLNLVLEGHQDCQAMYAELHNARNKVENLITLNDDLQAKVIAHQNSYDKAQATELENAALQEEVTIIPTLKTEIETLKLEKQELENEMKSQMHVSQVEINRRLAESPEVLELKKKLEETLEEKENEIKEKNSELLALKEKLKSYYEMQPKLAELQRAMSTLISTNEALEQERAIRDERAKETELEHQQTTENLMAVIETKETELRKRDEQIEKLHNTLQENCQERVDLDSDLLNAKKLINSLKSDEVKLKEELNAQQDAFEKVELSVQEMIKEKDSELLGLQEKLKSYSEMQSKLTELQSAMSALLSTNEALEQEKAIRDEKANVAEFEHQQTTEKLMAVIETKETELRKRDEQIEKLQNTLQENCQERVDLDSDLLNAQKLISSLKSDEVKLKEELKTQQDAFEKVELSVQTMIKEKNSELLDLKEKLKSYYEMQSKLIELEGTMSTLTLTNEALEQEKAIRDERAKETMFEHQQTTEKLMAVIETKETELRKRDEQIEKLYSSLQENHQERVDLDSDLLNAQKIISSLKSDKVKLKEKMKSQQDAIEKVELSVQAMKEELAMKQLEVRERDMNIDKLNRVLEDHEDCHVMYAELHNARNKVENLITLNDDLQDKVIAHQNSYEKAQATSRQLKADLDRIQQETGKLARGVVVTRGTQCDDLISELDQYKDASKHYRNRAHKAEFELKRIQKALGQTDEDDQSPERQHVPMELPPPKPQRSSLYISSKFRMVDSGIQCTLLNEMLDTSKISELEAPTILPIPELAKLQTDLKLTEIARQNLKIELSKCSCDRKLHGVTAAGKPNENIVKYKAPTGFQRKVAFFQGGSTRMNTKESVIQPNFLSSRPKEIQPRPIEEKEEPKIVHAPPRDQENNENAPEPVQVAPPDEEEPEDFSWLMKLVQKKT